MTAGPRNALRRESRRRADGFTLLELLMVMVVFGILTAISYPSWRGYQQSQSLAGSTRDLVSMMRHAQSSAVANSSTARVDLAADGKSATEFLLSSSGTYSQVRRLALPSGVSIKSSAFTARAGGSSPSLYFYSRGTATSGSLVVQRTSGATRTITVEGVTGRVSYQ